ncbi:Similar to CDYL2: Chromodomain Y-like protein 2 (Homo sapiens) [Cotesia congregata]|uniref:Similar to CDYL2: Chromodomain Y-like protein 2 (Homo sapiens) n=1 Tax=Cotesia congregata TaxID=51543 RepID=A0A8J2MRW0_COTCN|nr:Similar to CDYL2: Chromodomain Y-like protein 2 (Homo sapiens) [Cotesia congregata]
MDQNINEVNVDQSVLEANELSASVAKEIIDSEKQPAPNNVTENESEVKEQLNTPEKIEELTDNCAVSNSIEEIKLNHTYSKDNNGAESGNSSVNDIEGEKTDTCLVEDEKIPVDESQNKEAIEADQTKTNQAEVVDNSVDEHENKVEDKCDSAVSKNVNENVEATASEEQAAGDTIDMIEETIVIPSEYEAGEVISLNDKITVVSADHMSSEDTNDEEEHTETIEFNVIEYTDVEGNQELKVEKVESSNNENTPADNEKVDGSDKDSQDKDELKEIQDSIEDGAVENGQCVEEHIELLETEELSTSKAEGSEKKRSVIQDIFDDWRDENPEEDSASVQSHDTVELELKSLLDESSKPSEADVVTPKNVSGSTPVNETPTSGSIIDSTTKKVVKDDSAKAQLVKLTSLRTPDSIKNTSKLLTRQSGTPKSGELTDSLSSPSDGSPVTFKGFKSKDSETPRKEIIIVKKIKKQEAGQSAASSPSATYSRVSTEPENRSTVTSSEKASTDKELLAILEGDVDPDWSDLRPPSLVEEPEKKKDVTARCSSPPKLDPVTERELALKQLLELPATPKKLVVASKKKFTPKLMRPVKTQKEVQKDVKEFKEPKKAVNVDLVNKDSKEASEKELISIDLTSPSSEDLKVEETRSGRKRKPTEKAREYEISPKRQKSVKIKSTASKKSTKDSSSGTKSKNTAENNLNDTADSEVLDKDDSEGENTDSSSVIDNEVEEPESKADKTSQEEESAKKTKDATSKKSAPPSAKKKVTKPKPPTPKKAAPKSMPKKSPKATKTAKKNSDGGTPESKPKKKIIAEIDRLLQDEGVVNLLYDVEQPGKKRLVPVTQSQAKVMDIQKIQRELKIRTKLVRNAVLRLRTSGTSPANVTSRSKRHEQQQQQQSLQSTPEKKTQDSKSPRSSMASPTEFMFPAKIRNTAHESIIIRRHSSSSFSSASGSPRVSFDSGDRHLNADSIKMDDHPLRSNKRRLSQEDKKKLMPDSKKSKKDTEKLSDLVTSLPKSKPQLGKIIKKAVDKKIKKFIEDEDDSEDEFKRTKNGAAGKKKLVKSKVCFAKEEDDIKEEPTEQDDALSACLAEAVTALANENSGRTRAGAINKKSKRDAESIKAKDKIQFSNKELIVQRHGNLVQLILTPSTSSKIRNGITLQIMQEFREALAILKKDDDCRVVLLTSTGSSFCEGLELSTLLHENKDVRRVQAQKLANGVKDFIKSLATFNKPIVAGVQGTAVGLGVTMLPLFDLVIASDKATFSTPYGKLGQIAEGAAIFTLSHVLGSAVTSELLLGGRTLTANEALRAGLVTRVLWPDRFQVELLPSLRVMSEQSSQVNNQILLLS